MTASDTSYDIIIVGCGPAGIAAGLELQKYQPIVRFLILEARNRVGGRTYTDTQTFDTNEPIDLGARWIHHHHPGNPLSVHHTPSEKDRLHPDFFRTANTAFFDRDGTLWPDSLLAEVKTIVKKFWTNSMQYSSEKEDVSMLDVIRDQYNEITDERIRRLVDMNLAYIECYHGSNLDQLAPESSFKSDEGPPTYDLALPIGLGSFIEQIVQRHELPVQLNTVVTSVDIPSNKNELIRLTTHDHHHYSCQYLLITIPLGCLKARSIHFTPPLPDWKQEAIDRMGFGLLNKIYLQFPHTFWDERLDCFVISSNRFRFFLCFPYDNMLNLYIAGNLARDLEQRTDEEIIEEILLTLRPIYPQMPKPVKCLVSRWGSDPFAHGSYSNFKTGATYGTVRELARECYDGRVYWAGEHANYGGSIGCVDSAFESGHREAKRIYDQVSNTLS